MSILQILISLVLGSGLFGLHLFLRKLSPKFRNFDDEISTKEKNIIGGLFIFYNKITKIAIVPISNNYGYVAVANKEISRVYAAAPPTAPPACEIIPALLPTIFDEMSVENPRFSKPAIQNYISAKLITFDNLNRFESDCLFPEFFAVSTEVQNG